MRPHGHGRAFPPQPYKELSYENQQTRRYRRRPCRIGSTGKRRPLRPVRRNRRHRHPQRTRRRRSPRPNARRRYARPRQRQYLRRQLRRHRRRRRHRYRRHPHLAARRSARRSPGTLGQQRRHHPPDYGRHQPRNPRRRTRLYHQPARHRRLHCRHRVRLPQRKNHRHRLHPRAFCSAAATVSTPKPSTPL